MYYNLSPRFIAGFPKIRGTLFGGPHNKEYSILGSMLGSPYSGKLPYLPQTLPKPVHLGMLCRLHGWRLGSGLSLRGSRAGGRGFIVYYTAL